MTAFQTDRISNAERAERARKALANYNDEYDLIANCVDFLADLQHYHNHACAVANSHPTFEDVLETARQHFNAELAGEGRP
jgi:hypothetical protein